MPTPAAVAASPAPTVATVQEALDQKAAGNSLSYLRLTHILSAADHPHLSPLLTALTHFCAQPNKPIRHLLTQTLSLPLPPPDALPLLLENLISADATFIPPILVYITRLTTHPPPTLHPLLTRLLSTLLRSHPRAARLLVHTLLSRAPHPVRPASEHLAFFAAVLHILRQHPSLSPPLLHALLDRLANIEALVPALSAPALPPAADAVQAALLQLFAHLRTMSSLPDYANNTLLLLFDCYTRAIVHVDATRFAPYVLLYAANLADDVALLHLVNRLRLSFFDHELPAGLRERFLHHSTWLLVRARGVSADAARAWIATLARWLNRYLDGIEVVQADVETHRLFYKGCAALMAAVAAREDAFEVGGEDALNGMRMYRLMGCALLPMLVVERKVVEPFQAALARVGFEVDGTEGYVPSRSRGGGKNVCAFEIAEENCGLPEVMDMVQKYVRTVERVGSPASAIVVGDTFEGMTDE